MDLNKIGSSSPVELFFPIQSLDHEILTIIFQEVVRDNPRKLSALSLVCKSWKMLSDEYAWLRLAYFPAVIPSHLTILEWLKGQFFIFQDISNQPEHFIEKMSSMPFEIINRFYAGSLADQHCIFNLLLLIGEIYKNIFPHMMDKLYEYKKSYLLFLSTLSKILTNEQQKVLVHSSNINVRVFHFLQSFDCNDEPIEPFIFESSEVQDDRYANALNVIHWTEDLVHQILSFLHASKINGLPPCMDPYKEIIAEIEKISPQKMSRHFYRNEYMTEMYWHHSHPYRVQSVIRILLTSEKECLQVRFNGENADARWESLAATCSLIPCCSINFPIQGKQASGIELEFPLIPLQQLTHYLKFIKRICNITKISAFQIKQLIPVEISMLGKLNENSEVFAKTLCFNEFFLTNMVSMQIPIATHTLIGLADSPNGHSDYPLKYGSIPRGFKKKLEGKFEELGTGLKQDSSLKDRCVHRLLLGLQEKSKEAKAWVEKLIASDPTVKAIPTEVSLLKEGLNLSKKDASSNSQLK